MKNKASSDLTGKHQHMKKILIAVVGIAIVALGSYALFGGQPSAPSVNYTALDGRTASTDSLKGKVVLVNFWATSCSGCIAEMPQLKATHQQYAPRGYQTVAVAMSYDPLAYVQTFTAHNQLPFFVTHDSQGKAAQAFGDINLTPTSILIGKDGKIIKRYLGEPDFAELHQLIEQALAA